MSVRQLSISDARFERAPGQHGEVFAGNVFDQRDGGPITIGVRGYGPDQSPDEAPALDDVTVMLEGRLTVSTAAGTVTAAPEDIVHPPKGDGVTIRSHRRGAMTASVTCLHWQEARPWDAAALQARRPHWPW